ncbi:MAG: hypothetical protein ABSF93_18960, partial [Candidatus Sulfotelmatobacter sp.]
TAIQTDTKGAVDAIASIGDVIHQVSDISNTIAAAVEEQSTTTNAMTRNVSDAARGSEEITQNIAGVVQAARVASTGAQELHRAGSELAEMAARLRTVVAQFKIESKASSGEQLQPAERIRHLAAAAGK